MRLLFPAFACLISVSMFGQTVILTLNNVPENIICTETWTVDHLGREVNHTTNKPLFHIYDNGSVEKKFIIQ